MTAFPVPQVDAGEGGGDTTHHQLNGCSQLRPYGSFQVRPMHRRDSQAQAPRMARDGHSKRVLWAISENTPFDRKLHIRLVLWGSKLGIQKHGDPWVNKR
jgi:hypothetical protein